MQMKGGDAIARMLKQEGVEVVFGIIDGTYFGFYSSLAKYGIELISPRHETCAAHMAGAYARTTGKLGVCMASNGPGVANILPGIAVENAEGNRVMVITSSRRMEIIYPDRGGTYQFFDHVGAIKHLAKYSEAVKTHGRIVETVRQAFRKTWAGRPGVVHIDVPENIINSESEFSEGDFLEPKQYRRVNPIYPNREDVKEAAKMLCSARFPIIHAGSGVLHAMAFEELKTVAEALSTPVVTSWGARGVISEDNELAIPMIYVDLNNEIRKEADLVLTLGSRMGETDWWGKMPNWAHPLEQKMIQVDLEDEFIGRNKPVSIGIVADVKVFLQMLYEEIKNLKAPINNTGRKEILNKFLNMKQKERAKLDEALENMNTPMHSAHVATICDKVFKDNAIGIYDGGNANIWGQFYHKAILPGMGVSTPKMGMLGAGVAQALGAQVAHPDRQVYCIIGDGAFGFHPQEVETAIRNNLKIIYLVLCDKQWGMVKMNQQFALRPIKTLIKKSLDADEVINTDFSEIEFDKMAESMGAFGIRVSDPTKLEHAIKMCMEAGKCSVIHIDVDPVKHMWAPSLMHFKKMHDEPKGK
jgi:acetolactate synthase-1/2/3 large subunit